MIKFINNSNDQPFKILRDKYKEALSSGQKSIEALVISSFSRTNNEVDSRSVNLKIVDGKELIFFSNYNSPKSLSFLSHDQISALLYWNKINVQIRIKAKIKRTPSEFNNEYFKHRSHEKNALAISSNQSNKIASYEDVSKNYKKSLREDNLELCPEYWGGYSFIPYYFEFWEGHDSRLNKREVYEMKNNEWDHFILQP